MEGEAWTYGDCAQALSTLAHAMETRSWLNYYANTVIIWVGGQRQIRVTITTEQGRDVHLGQHTLTALADFYPHRTLPRTNIKRALNSMIQSLRGDGEALPVPYGWFRGKTSLRVQVILDFEEDAAQPFPLFNFGHVVQLLNAVQLWYDGIAQCGELWGAIYFHNNLEPIGRFHVVMQHYDGSEPPSMGNSTSQTADFRL